MKKQTKGKASPKIETLVNFILDKSGSMESVRESTISGFNEYVNTLKKDKNKYSFSLTLFDTVVTTPFSNIDLDEVKPINKEYYAPNGMTALYDAVCTTIKSVKEKKNQKVLVIIMTDGEENSSKEFSEKEMASLIKEKEKKGNWTFVYLGANQDSYKKAQQYGISQMNVSNYKADDHGTMRAMSAMAMNTSSFAGGGGGGTNAFFSAKDQDHIENGAGNGISGASAGNDPISAHFSSLGKKSWEAKKKKLGGN